MAEAVVPDSDVLEKIKQEREVERNKQEALTMAAKIFKIISDPQFSKLTPIERHQLCIKKNQNFAQAYPLVTAKMAKERRYNETAFKRFLDGLHKNPGKGMEGYVEHQARYVKLLYEEECKAAGKHINTRIAKEIFEKERRDMMAWIKDIKKKEKAAKNEYEDESKKNLAARRAELLEFINTVRPAPAESADLTDLIAEDEAYVNSQAPEKEPEPIPEQVPKRVSEPEVEKNERVAEALKQRQKLLDEANPNKSDWLQDSNVPNWKKVSGKKK